jgi:hypothetical protein
MSKKLEGRTKGKAATRAKAAKRITDLNPKSGDRVRGGASGDPLKGLNVDKGGSAENTLGWTWKKGG